jgi:hypothetical protein
MGNTKKNPGQKRAQKAQSRKQKLKLVKSQLQAKNSLAFSKQGKLHECLISDSFDEGIGHIIFSFELADGKIGVANFLVDSYCLGVKNTLHAKASYEEYDMMINYMQEASGLNSTTPCYAKKMVIDSVSYANSLGIKPHHDYERLLAELVAIDETQCRETFVFGYQGEPLYIAGPHDDFTKSKEIIDTLHKNCGEGNYEYVAMLDDDYDLLDDQDKKAFH